MIDRSEALVALREMIATSYAEDTWPTGRPRGVAPTSCLCGAQSTTPLATEDRHGLEVATVVCDHCGTVRSSVALTPLTYDRYYSEYYRPTHSRVEREELLARERGYASELAKYVRWSAGQRIGEVGCGCGGTLLGLGADVTAIGCEIDPELAQYGYEHGADVRYGPSQVLPRDLDLIYAVHVLEHCPRPVAELREWAWHVPVGGRVVVVVPDLLAIKGGHHYAEHGSMRAWWDLAHVWHWTAATLRIPLELAGLEITSIDRAGPGTLASVGSLVAVCRRVDRRREIIDYCTEGGDDAC